MRIARTIYEALPWAYIILGAAAIAASYLWRQPLWTEALAVCGLVAIVLGLMLALRRRDYRIQQRHYGAELEDED
jgi:formate hydrogenlyase subunit 3/multisubunit Na+/H+ antiporter MnhD subunit